jgi:hypothetical protein
MKDSREAVERDIEHWFSRLNEIAGIGESEVVRLVESRRSDYVGFDLGVGKRSRTEPHELAERGW